MFNHNPPSVQVLKEPEVLWRNNSKSLLLKICFILLEVRKQTLLSISIAYDLHKHLLVAKQVCSHFVDGKHIKEKDINGPEDCRKSVANALLKLLGSQLPFHRFIFPTLKNNYVAEYSMVSCIYISLHVYVHACLCIYGNCSHIMWYFKFQLGLHFFSSLWQTNFHRDSNRPQ